MIHQRLIVFVHGLLLLAGYSVPSIGALTPEQAVQQSQRGPGGKPAPIDMLGRRTLPNGTVIVRAAQRPPHHDTGDYQLNQGREVRSEDQQR